MFALKFSQSIRDQYRVYIFYYTDNCHAWVPVIDKTWNMYATCLTMSYIQTNIINAYDI